jgi:shikimate dehydrogenase
MKPIVFIGMPGSGKTTISKKIAELLNLTWLETDSLIEQQFKLTIPQIFERFGEAAFRTAESEITAECCNRSGVVISLGGGAVLFNEAVIAESSIVVYLTRSIDNIYTALLEQADARPLTKSKEDLIAAYGARHEIYERMADITADNNSVSAQTVQYILEELHKCEY